MIRQTLGLMAAFTLTAALLVGCQADTEPIAGSPDDAAFYPKVTLSNRSLQEALGVSAPIQAKTETGNVKVMLPVRARTSNASHIEYRIVWFDASGQAIRPQMEWKPKRLEQKQPEQLTFLATSADAVDYNIQIRWGLR